MDLKQIAESGVAQFNDRSFRTKSKELFDPNAVTVDVPTKQEFKGIDGYVQYANGYVTAMPDVKATVLDHKVEGNKVTTRVRGTGTFTGTMQTPKGDVPGNGKKLDAPYSLIQDFNAEGKVTRFAVDYDLQDFMKQLGIPMA